MWHPENILTVSSPHSILECQAHDSIQDVLHLLEDLQTNIATSTHTRLQFKDYKNEFLWFNFQTIPITLNNKDDIKIDLQSYLTQAPEDIHQEMTQIMNEIQTTNPDLMGQIIDRSKRLDGQVKTHWYTKELKPIASTLQLFWFDT